MHQLTGLDASFLYLETTNTPMHIGSLCIYDQSTAPGGHVRFKDILSFYEQRLHRARVFRQSPATGASCASKRRACTPAPST